MTTANGTPNMTQEQMAQEIASLRAENAKLNSQKTLKGGMKVSEKGAMSLYGLGRFPVTLYKAQWIKLLAQTDEIKAYLLENDSKLATKE